MAQKAKKVVATVRTGDGFEVYIPPWVVDHSSFLQWLRSGVVPEDARIGYVRDRVWYETMSERAFAHNKVKTLVARVLDGIAANERLGVYFGDGMTFTSEEEKFTCVPDGMFVSRAAVDAGRVRLVGGRRSDQDTELVGVPDLVIEVVSNHSEAKDNAWLMSKHADVGIPEYWVIDGRTEPLRFMIYKLGAKGYTPVRKADGWSKSAVLARSFRFVPDETLMGHRTYRLETR